MPLDETETATRLAVLETQMKAVAATLETTSKTVDEIRTLIQQGKGAARVIAWVKPALIAFCSSILTAFSVVLSYLHLR